MFIKLNCWTLEFHDYLCVTYHFTAQLPPCSAGRSPSLGSRGSSPLPAGGASTPTLDGNRTSEICGRIDSTSLSVGDTLGVGEFGAVLKGVWLSPAGDQVARQTALLAVCSLFTLYSYVLQLGYNCSFDQVVTMMSVSISFSHVDYICRHNSLIFSIIKPMHSLV